MREALRNLALQATAQPGQALYVLRQQVFIDTRLVIEPLRVPRGDELDQIVIALVGLREQDQMVRRLPGIPALSEAAAGRHVNLAPQNRLDAMLARVIVEDHRREQVP